MILSDTVHVSSNDNELQMIMMYEPVRIAFKLYGTNYSLLKPRQHASVGLTLTYGWLTTCIWLVLAM